VHVRGRVHAGQEPQPAHRRHLGGRGTGNGVYNSDLAFKDNLVFAGTSAFAPFVPGQAREYLVTAIPQVTTTAGDATPGRSGGAAHDGKTLTFTLSTTAP
jgi:hypothetical protein